MDFTCPQCGNHVRINIHCPDLHQAHGVEAWCCTRHPKPIRMELRDDD